MKRKTQRRTKKQPVNRNLVVSDCTTIPDLQERFTQMAINIDILLLDIIETAYNTPAYKEQLKEIYDGIAPVTSILRGTVEYFNREEGLLTPNLEKVEDNGITIIAETNEQNTV
jgi:hypothetical protein